MGIKIEFHADVSFFRLGNVQSSISLRGSVFRVKKGLSQYDLPLGWIKKQTTKPPQIVLVDPVRFRYADQTGMIHLETGKRICIIEANFVSQVVDQATGQILWPEQSGGTPGQGFKFLGFP